MAIDPQTGFEARCLLRAARAGTLATLSAPRKASRRADGGPDDDPEGGAHAALVTPATLPGLEIVLLLSGLSMHARALAEDPRCALLVAGPAQGANPQARPRLTVRCRAEPLDDGPDEAEARARYLAVHPYAAAYAGLGDFRIWRLQPRDGLLVAGFGRAIPLPRAQLAGTLDAREVGALLSAARALLPDCRVVGGDGDGLDLADGERTARRAFAHPITHPRELEAALRGTVAETE